MSTEDWVSTNYSYSVRPLIITLQSDYERLVRSLIITFCQNYATINHGMVQLFYSSMNECANMRGEFAVSTILQKPAVHNKQQYTEHKFWLLLSHRQSIECKRLVVHDIQQSTIYWNHTIPTCCNKNSFGSTIHQTTIYNDLFYFLLDMSPWQRETTLN